MAFYEILKQERESKGLTQQQLAEAAGISVRMVQLYERGTSYPRANVAKKLAQALGTTVSNLLSEQDALLADAEERGGASAKRDVAALISEVSALFAGGSLDESEKDEVIEALTFAYWDAKKKNKKYSGKKG